MRFRFPPLDRRVLLLGLPAVPLITLATGLVAAVVVLGTVPGVLGPAGAVGVVTAAAVAGCWPLAGDPPVRWLPLVVLWLARRGGLPVVDPAPLAGITGTGPTRGATKGQTPTRRGTGPPGVVLWGLAPGPGDPAIGVIDDRRSGWRAAVLPVQGPALGLLGPGAQAQQVARWGGVLAALARDGTAIRRLQWVQRCAPADPSPLLRAAQGASGPAGARRSYATLVAAEAASLAAHRTLLVLAVGTPRSLPGRRSDVDVDEVLRRELRLVTGQLRGAGITAGPPLGADELVAELSAAGDPTAPARGGRPASPWPTALQEGWGAVRIDGTCQATYWIAEWPRLPVGPDVLTPLLTAGSARTLAVCLAPMAPDRPARQAQSARTAGMADDALRAQAGFVTTARRTREAEAVRRREFELADGHGDFRFSGYVGVAAPTVEVLESRCGEIEQAARGAGLVLRRLYGRQAEARTWTLPLGRGLS